MDVPAIARVLLRLAHALAAAAWLGGGAYYAVVLRPRLKDADEVTRAWAIAAQKEFGEWASVTTLVMIATGAVLMFDRLADGRGTVVYVSLLGVKIVSAVLAFWLVGALGRRRSRARGGTGKPKIDRTWLVLALGTVAFAIGVVLSSVYPTGVGQR
ncbi:MAG: copper resistance protein CopD [Thermomicrobiaceae bacterium]|nr:copper resistance protein CopD [Thermomicrobiaceae bacterium]